MKFRSTKQPLVSIIIVNWNTRKFLAKCLCSIHDQKTKYSFEVIVIDNNSKDNSAEMVRKDYPWVKLIANKINNGYAIGNNQGYKISNGEYILFLNPDTKLYPNTLTILVEFMKSHPEAGSCAPQMINPNRTIQRLGFYRRTPSLTSMFFSHGPFRPLVFSVPNLKQRYFEQNDFHNIHEIDQPPGACFFTKRTVLNKVGCMEEKYELYFEDVDLAFKIKRRGYKQFLVPKAKIMHYVGRSNLQLNHGKRTLMYYQSMHKFFLKFHGKTQARIIKWIVLTRYIYTISILSLLFIPRKLFRKWGGKTIILSELQSLYKWLQYSKWI